MVQSVGEKISSQEARLKAQEDIGCTLTSVKAAHSTANQACIFYNKDKCKQNNDHTNNGIFYHHCCSYFLKETSKHYDHPVTQCLCKLGSSGQPKPDTATNKAEKPRS